MVQNEKMYNKLNAMSNRELKDFAKKHSIRVVSKSKTEMIEQVMNITYGNLYGACMRCGYVDINNYKDLEGIKRIAKIYELEYDDVKVMFKEAELCYKDTSYQNRHRLQNAKAPLVIIGIMVLISILIAMCTYNGPSINEWSQLTPEEQDRARWAYDVQQAADDYRRDHPGR